MLLLRYVRGIEVLGGHIGGEEREGDKEWTEKTHSQLPSIDA
jgi:hypothetical protein